MQHLCHRLRSLPHPAPARTEGHTVEQYVKFEEIQHHRELNMFKVACLASSLHVLWLRGLRSCLRSEDPLNPDHTRPTTL